jgi:hypothetical protein
MSGRAKGNWGSAPKWASATGALAALGLSVYFASMPYFAAASLRAAFDAKDPVALEKLTDIAAIRASFRSQADSAIAGYSGGILGAIATTLAMKVSDAAIATLVTPEFLISIVAAQGAAASPNANTDPPARFVGATMGYESFSRFVVRLPYDDTTEVKLFLTRSGIDWKLTSVVIPPSQVARVLSGP